MSGHKSIGDQAEDDAKSYLLSNNLSFREQNYSCKFGEIDLIMQTGPTIVFVEVRYRSSSTFGGAAASVSLSKQDKIRQTAKHYLVKNRLFDKCPVRFDVVACSNDNVDWIQGAF